MKKQLVSLLIVILSFLGLLDASFLTYEKLNHIVPPCSNGFQCNTVLSSPYSSVGPIPLSMFGMAFYIVMFSLSIMHFLEVKTIRLGDVEIRTHDLMFAQACFGALFSAYLITIMGVVLQAWCLYCLLSALCCASLFFFNAMLWSLNKTSDHGLFSVPRLQMVHFLYGSILKRFFFLLSPELIHTQMVRVGEVLGMFALTRAFTSWVFADHVGDELTQTIDGITFKRPVGLSAGFDWDGRLTQILPSLGFGFMTIGTVTLHPYEGNPRPRLGRFPRSKALLVNKGFQNIGVEAIVKKLEPLSFAIPVGISIGSTNMVFASPKDQISDIVACFKVMDASKVAHSYYELNISCPNTKGGQPFTTPDRLEALLTALKKLKINKPVYIKMPIDLKPAETKALLTTAAEYPYITGVIFGNLTKDKTNPAVDPADLKVWKTKAGNLSGKPTFDRSNDCISLVKKYFGKRFTIIGTGGIFTPEDALEKQKRGAVLFQLITGMIFTGPSLIGRINAYLGETYEQ